MAASSSPAASIWIASPTWSRTSTARRISNRPRSAAWSANGSGTCPRPARVVERDGIRLEVLVSRRIARRPGSHQQVPNGCSMTELKTEFKSGFVSIIGRPNAGKSTLLNALVGQKVAIVADKPQTTRTSIQGVVTLPEAQIVFVDTPGIHQRQFAAQQAPDGYGAQLARRARPAAVRGRRGAQVQRTRTSTPSTWRAARDTPVRAGAQQDRPGQGQGAPAAADRAVQGGCTSSRITFRSPREARRASTNCGRSSSKYLPAGPALFSRGPRDRPAGALSGRRTDSREGAARHAPGGAARGGGHGGQVGRDAQDDHASTPRFTWSATGRRRS